MRSGRLNQKAPFVGSRQGRVLCLTGWVAWLHRVCMNKPKNALLAFPRCFFDRFPRYALRFYCSLSYLLPPSGGPAAAAAASTQCKLRSTRKDVVEIPCGWTLPVPMEKPFNTIRPCMEHVFGLLYCRRANPLLQSVRRVFYNTEYRFHYAIAARPAQPWPFRVSHFLPLLAFRARYTLL